MDYQVQKQYFSKSIIESCILLSCLCVTFVTPLLVDEELYDPTRSGKIFFFVQWLVLLIPFGLYAMVRNRKQAVGKLPRLMLAWFLWIFLRGKFGGIWNDEKFFWFAGCFVFYFLAEAILKNALKKNHFDLLLIPSTIIAIVATIEATLGLLQLYGKFQVYHGLYTISGTFFNPAPYAGFLLASMPFALYLTSLKRKKIIHHICYWLGYISVLLIIIAIPLTRSRAAYLGLMGVVIVWGFYRYKPFITFIWSSKQVANIPYKVRHLAVCF